MTNNTPISSLPIVVSLSGSEAVVMDQAGTTKTGTVSLINSVNPANLPTGGILGQALVKTSSVNYATAWQTVSGLGTVQSVATGTGLTGGTITVSGTLSLASISTGNVLANTSGVSAAPTPTTPSAVLDVIGSTQGDILYRGASGWNVLAPGISGQILTTGGGAANPSWSAAGSGTATSVGLALPSSIMTVSGSPVTTTGTLTGTLATQAANEVWAGPTTGSASAPTFRALVGADLPNPSASSLGGIQSAASVSNQWINSISTSGVPSLSQPAFANISGTVAAAQLPNPTTSSLGGVQAINAVASNWINSINTSGIPQLSQPGFSNLSGNATLSQLPSIGNNTLLSNITGASSTPLANSLSSVIDSAIGNTQGDVIYRGASAWSVLAPGSNGQVFTTGGAAANPSWQTISGTGTVTSIATNNGLTGGTITTTGTIGLASIATGNVLAYMGASTGTPTATTPSAVLDIIGNTEGDILYRGASTWAALAPGTNGQFLQTAGAGSTPVWATVAGLTISNSSVTGTSTTYTSGQGGVNVERSNSGSVMTDTLPGTGTGVLPANTVITVTNADTSAILVMSAGSGATIKGQLPVNGFLYLGPGQSLQIQSDGSNYWPISVPTRVKLGANTSIFVATTGSDTTSHGVTSGSPFLTTSHAWLFAQNNLDLNGFVLTISHATGNYAQTITLSGNMVGQNSPASVIVQGNTTTPSNVTLGGGTGVQLTVDTAKLQFQGFQFNPVTGQSLVVTDGAVVNFQNNITQASSGASLTAVNNGVLRIIGNYQLGTSPSSNEGVHWNANNGGRISIEASGITITVVGAPAWSTSFAIAQSAGGIFFDFVPTFSGSASGSRYSAVLNGVINTSGSGASYLPGNSAGSTAMGGQYN